MKKIILLSLTISICLIANSQGLNINKEYSQKKQFQSIEIKNASKLSTSCKLFILRLRDINYNPEMELDNKFIKDNLIEIYDGMYFIGGLLKIDTELIDIEILNSYGIKVNSKINNIWTVKVPIDQLEKFTDIDGIIFFEKSTQRKRFMDDAKSQTNVDDVHSGTGLNTSYKGNDVVVGIIDGGFDYTHPAFEDNNGNVRIKRVWEQMWDQNNTPPSGYNYGHELIQSADILAFETDAFYNSNGTLSVNGSHGSHVAGTAAGSDNAINGAYGGCAPESDLVFVSTTMMDDAMLDGISYIFDYASSENKPATINLSIGGHYGPHDGTSLFDQALQNLVGNQKVLVGAAGNEGSNKIHLDVTFQSTIDSAFTSILFGQNSPACNVDSWSDVGTDFGVKFQLWDPTTLTLSDATNWGSASANMNAVSFVLTGSDGGQVQVEISSESSSPLNSKPHINFGLQSTTNDVFELAILGQNNTVHLWNSGTTFSDQGESFWLDGNNDYSVGEIGGTGTNMITVGAYTSKSAFTNSQGATQQTYFPGTIGDIASFSSLGPTADGRIKPDITAPGNVIVSALNSFDPEYQQGGDYFDDFATAVGSNNWPYGGMSGTSMATPMVTGIIALLFDINPNLSFNDIKQLIQSTAITDNFTGSVPNNTWGSGKIDALGAAQATTPTSVNQYTSNDIFIYPNPANEFVNIYIPEYISSEKIILFDNLGREVMSSDYSGKLNLNTSSLSQGIYFLETNDNKKIYREKLIIN